MLRRVLLVAKDSAAPIPCAEAQDEQKRAGHDGVRADHPDEGNGSSTREGDLPKDRPVPFNDVLATIYHQLGVPTDTIFYDQLGRPNPVLAVGSPIAELI